MSMLNRIAVAASIADFAVKKFFFDLLKVDTVAATGSLISDAAPLSYGKNVVTAANGTKAVRLPKSVVDSSVVIVNTVSNQTLIVFPELAGDQINAIANPQLPNVGDRYLGTVVKITNFGAFVSLVPGRDGLLHISEVKKLVPGKKRIDAVEDVLSVGQKLQVEIKEVDQRGKLSLIPVVEEAAAPADAEA